MTETTSPVPMTGTYRLQLHAEAGFAAAQRIVPYLADLGVSHLYLSPVLQAAPGSMHGYDVVDHTRISAELGGESGLIELAARAHEHGLGLICDVVPNHMTVPAATYLNQPLWEVLRDGRDAGTASWFDIDWDLCDGRIGLPFLGQPLDAVLAAGELTLGDHAGDPVLRYHDQVFPIASDTAGGAVADVLSRQHYVLASWRDKAEILGYRRFFDVDRLIAVRVELPEVFHATHRTLIDLHRRGVIDGFRIDHPDGLTDPEDYLERLRAATNGAWVVVEKILEGDEELPRSWTTAGTTGYDALKVIQTALTPPTGAALDEQWREVGGPTTLQETELESKSLVIDRLLQPELHRLVRRATGAAADAGMPLETPDVEAALRELLVHVSVYRAYVRPGHEPSQEALSELDLITAKACAARPQIAPTIEVLRRLLADTETTSADGRDLMVRFQQVCGPVMAKGVEDTTFYRFHRLTALNEVGGDPAALEGPDPAALHLWAEAQLDSWPDGLTTLSTHDTKRDEDVRARLLAAAEDVIGWRALWSLVEAAAGEHGVDAPTAYLLMQTLVGAWPLTPERLSEYLLKAAREAKMHTTWSDPDEAYERRLLGLGARCLSGELAEAIESWLAELGSADRAVALGAKLLQLTLSGVPDVYQGCEGVQRSLVDPDNRRPVDFSAHAERLASLDNGAASRDLADDKLWVISRALRLRRARPELFGAKSTYRAIPADSPHLLGFVRSERVATVVTRWPGGLARAGWGTATFSLPDGSWRNVLDDQTVNGGAVRCDQLLSALPVALLLRESE